MASQALRESRPPERFSPACEVALSIIYLGRESQMFWEPRPTRPDSVTTFGRPLGDAPRHPGPWSSSLLCARICRPADLHQPCQPHSTIKRVGQTLTLHPRRITHQETRAAGTLYQCQGATPILAFQDELVRANRIFPRVFPVILQAGAYSS